jgi:hypothetical protein
MKNTESQFHRDYESLDLPDRGGPTAGNTNNTTYETPVGPAPAPN